MTQRDYSHDVSQIRAALHRSTGSRASVMVGAGFSFNAKKRYSTARSFPSWATLTESLVKRLYPDCEKQQERAMRNAGSTSGALRLSEEFEAAFGRTVLLNHVREIIPDREHEPGTLHQELLKLSWADVFTTNYDTLLERAAIPLRQQRYEVVRCVGDLPLKQSPRIVKLHGTLPELRDLILTEEDYRTYPDKFSPFVAEVQVAMVEKHLSLVGFSGDDPNFLAWSGWVRDRLGCQTLPIYLWLFEEPTTFQSRMFEQRWIIPIPLFAITNENDRESALHKFIKLLAKPDRPTGPRWCLPRYMTDTIGAIRVNFAADHPQSVVADDWINTAIKWRGERLQYPGWMIPHVKAIESLWSLTEDWAYQAATNPDTLLSLTEPECLFVLSELLWRLRRAIFPLYDQLALVTFDKSLERYKQWRKGNNPDTITITQAPVSSSAKSENQITIDVCELDASAMEMHLERLRHSREIRMIDRFASIIQEIESQKQHSTRFQQEHVEHSVKYERALLGLSNWDDHLTFELLSEWNTSSVPVWALRRAGLLIEIGKRNIGERILNEALNALRTMADEGTPETWSIESWVTYALNQLEQIRHFFAQEVNGNEPQQNNISADRVVPEESGMNSYMENGSEPPTHGSPNRSRNNRSEHLQETLNWLRERDCDPAEILEWIEVQNSIESTRPPIGETRIHAFDSRNWRVNINLGDTHLNNRMVAASRWLRLLEDAGLMLRVGNVHTNRTLIEKAIRILSVHNSREALTAVLRLRNRDAITQWLTRSRIAEMPAPDVQQLFKIANTCMRREVFNPVVLDPNSIQRGNLNSAFELLSRAAIRQSDEVLVELLSFALSLPSDAAFPDEWWILSEVAKLIKRICGVLSPLRIVEILPYILTTPVPSSLNNPSFNGLVRWFDPVRAITRRETPATSSSDHLNAAIHLTIDRIKSTGSDPSLGTERRFLILRLTHLCDCQLLSSHQKTEFANALFEHRDPQTGMPKDTGCLDSLILMLPAVPQIDEHKLFVDKYITLPWPDDFQNLCSTLDSLARTGPISLEIEFGRERGIKWTSSEMEEIALRCRSEMDKQVLSITKENERNQDLHPLHYLSQPVSPRQMANEVSRRIANLIDQVLLQRESVSWDNWQIITETVTVASAIGLPVLHVYPKLASFDSTFTKRMVELLVESLTSDNERTQDRGETRFQEGLFALNHWVNQLDDSRIPSVSTVVLSVLGRQLDRGYTRGLIHVIDTIRNLIFRLPDAQSRRLFEKCEPSLKVWSSRFKYESDITDTNMRDELPDLRASMTKLYVNVLKRGFKSVAADNWIDLIKNDSMPEIRRALSE